ncbi:NAD(P)-dependent alcohol dehydrogenase [Actinocrispum wychmicini]|uniref:NADPH:quinone reductase-like Zn-dependent oxidoreductase n=1 Tax=Actinocrispum wychmicini TaxID=1213861 RepID=A0A4R2IIA2_9PSEU|nr:NAD(P)-dependent alcohol dehydrogenase [Actinocrispum wychmicini]TCO44267.1 NADPH:quinone reductase-like Zn-dependent oxidoreductase [Actinocrispum wychmicini]
MKAIVQDRYGAADVLTFADVDRPPMTDDDVLVRVHAAGVDPGVWHLMAGLPYPVRLVSGLRRPKVRIRGMDVAGTVEAVGTNVTALKPGDEVFGTCEGAFAEYVRVRAEKVAPKPANLTFEGAAVVPISGSTALQALQRGKVRSGQRVLVIGAAGGVGTFAVQLAKAFGAHVTGVCSTAKIDLVTRLGADDVIDYTRAEITGTYDLILDTAGNRRLSRLRAALTPTGTVVLVGGEGGGKWFGGNGRALGAVMLNPFVRHSLLGLLALVRPHDLRALSEFIAAGRVVPVIDRTFPLADVPEAVRHIHNGRAAGKVVVTV